MSDAVILYDTEDGGTQLRLKIQDGTVWLSQAEMAELFQTTKQNVSLHLKAIFRDAELAEASVVKDYLTTAADGKGYQTKHYRLEAVLAVGYRVRSPRGSQFRRWATTVLQDYLIKGFAGVVDLKQVVGRIEVKLGESDEMNGFCPIAWGFSLSYKSTNNTPQAYPMVRQRDAQTGGLLLSGGCHEV